MAFTIVQSAFSGSYGTSNNINWGSNTTPGNLLICGYVFSGDPGTISNILSNYVAIPGSPWANTIHLNLWAYPNAASQPAGGNDLIWTNTVAGAGFLIEVSPNGQVDTGASESSGTSTAMSGGSVSTTSAIEIIFGVFGQGAATVAPTGTPPTFTTPSSGFTLLNTASATHGNVAPKTAVTIGLTYDIVSSTGTFTPALSSNDSLTWIGVTLGIKAAQAGTLHPVISAYPSVWDWYRGDPGWDRIQGSCTTGACHT